jgi:ribokinase
MIYDVITIGDCMKDTFLFPSLEEMEKPIEGEKMQVSGRHEKYDEYLVFGLGDKISIEEADYAVGGTAANVAAGLTKLGFKTGLVSAFGSDETGDEIKKHMDSLGVDTSFSKIYRGKKSSLSVIVSYKGERTIFAYHSFGPNDFKLPQVGSTWLYIGSMRTGYDQLFGQIVAEKVKHDLKIAINPGSEQIEAGLNSFGGLLRLIDIIFVNRQEAQKLAGLPGVPTIKDMAKVIQLQGPQTVVITDGKEGAYAYNGADFFKVGSYPGHRLEATGAGDAFASGYLAATIGGEEIKDALKWGVINGASVVSKVGAQEGLLGKNTIQRRAKEYRWPADTLRFS